MSNIPFAIEVQKRFIHIQEEKKRRNEYIELYIQKLKDLIISKAENKKVAFSIFFRHPPCIHLNDSESFPEDTQEEISKFLKVECFYFCEWEGHIFISLIKSPKE